ncbi:Stk1 family PASTA domain-containing Ser/Thr kinase [Kibdelosporangium phytohabitans]|uniref:non-specific serine/threonine protein kinase n=1 Tax=Kibdelosporangium phytohabitans TaxID=860235 RepID=A0A0N9HUC1_9PSEU|nr:Stk1 family PASTA domain-containing Ser/Thr kinase [Kibdelosporangium phytohabitans]ALG05547.1 serine/threonine protein kinase [Kibdelosporangium phytohabitans]MBE1466494.1 serine/threonine-protein kinase [Kibdelosporangium phytohabitans]
MTTPRLLSNRYELGETLGYGGMSEVHKGRDVRLGRDVAVKVLRADLARDPQFQERFRREAQNAAALNHPAIVAVYDTGETRTEYGPLPYIVMEYVDGRTLRDIVKTEGPLPGQRAMEIMADVCAALDFSHRHGIVHRDVKPANVMITKTGAVKVMDFGIARAVHDGQAAVTQTAAVIGTAQYLSPEQARGEAVDARSDVYATGCVLFELLTGEPPFTGDSPVAVAYQHVREDPRKPSQVNSRVSPQLDAIVLKAMAKGAANRYQSAAEMRMDIVRVLSGQRPSAPMVMTEDDRTAMLGQQTRINDTPRGRHRPDSMADDYDDYDSDEEERKRKRRKAWMTALITLLVVAVIVLGIWLTTKLLSSNNNGTQFVDLPAVTGVQEAAARTQLTKAGFKVSTEDVKCEPAGPGQTPPCTAENVGNVIKQDPAPGKVEQGSVVKLSIGRGASSVKVPDVKGKDKNEAIRLITEAGLVPAQDDSTEETSETALVNKVASTNPPIGLDVPKGTKVTLSIGKAQAQKDVPNVVGQDFAAAKSNLESEGFKVSRTDVDSDQPKDIVVNQSPKSKARPNSTITLQVSKGQQQSQTPNPDQIEMPNLVGMNESVARQTLRNAGWSGDFKVTPETTNDVSKFGQVDEQDPQPGTKISKNQTVNVSIFRQVRPGG